MAVVRWDPALYCSKVLRPRRVIIFYCHSTWQPALVCIGSFSRGFRAILTNKRASECLLYLVGKGKMPCISCGEGQRDVQELVYPRLGRLILQALTLRSKLGLPSGLPRNGEVLMRKRLNSQ